MQNAGRSGGRLDQLAFFRRSFRFRHVGPVGDKRHIELVPVEVSDRRRVSVSTIGAERQQHFAFRVERSKLQPLFQVGKLIGLEIGANLLGDRSFI